jgi:hypothetical protein
VNTNETLVANLGEAWDSLTHLIWPSSISSETTSLTKSDGKISSVHIAIAC